MLQIGTASHYGVINSMKEMKALKVEKKIRMKLDYQCIQFIRVKLHHLMILLEPAQLMLVRELLITHVVSAGNVMMEARDWREPMMNLKVKEGKR
jgi:hypothetical protein